MTRAKPRIALIGMGVMGGGALGQGIPVLVDLFERLSAHFTIVFYCLQSVDRSKVPSGIIVRDAVSWPVPGRLKYLFVIARFVWDQLRNPCKLIFSVSVYPTGRIAIMLGKLFRLPVVVQIIALEAVALSKIGYGNLIDPWLRKITQHVCEEADELVAVAQYQKEVAKISLPTDRDIVVLPLRIDYTKFAYVSRSISYPVQFIHIAYYSPIKDQDTMFAAFAKVASYIDCHLTVIGDGFDIPSVHKMIHSLNIVGKVTFKGIIAQVEIPSYFKDAHILLHTARFETGCAVIQEAMASGVAVCGTKVGILADIDEQYAITVPTEDSDGLAEKILKLVSEQTSYRQMTTLAYHFISTYDAVWAARNYEIFLKGKLDKN